MAALFTDMRQYSIASCCCNRAGKEPFALDVRLHPYNSLVPLAQTMEKKGRLLGAVVCYRALLTAILTRAYARAYGHAADYLGALRQLDLRVHGYDALPTHEAFEAALRNMHGRKVAFWGRLRA